MNNHLKRTGEIIMYGLLGERLGHSYSKIIHESMGYEYHLIEKAPHELKDFIRRRDFSGLNVTIPYKKEVIKYCDEISELAERIGAVNTLYYDSTDKLIGTNTDYTGLSYALTQAKISLKGRHVLILGGTGGAGSMVKILAQDLGASKITIVSRGQTKSNRQYSSVNTADAIQHVASDQYADAIQHVASDQYAIDDATCPISITTYDTLPKDAEIIINATPVGTYPDITKSPVSLKNFKNCVGVCDLIYNPLRTELLMQAAELGIPYTNGLPMLVRQATAAADFFHKRCIASSQENSYKQNRSQHDSDRNNIDRRISEHVSSVHQNSDRNNIDRCISEHVNSVHQNFDRNTSGENSFSSLTPVILKNLIRDTENVVITGMPGCGKSTIGSKLARKTGRRFVDTDETVKEMYGRTPAEIIKHDGEEIFRKMEEKAVLSLAKEHSLVIATGGGVVTRPANVRHLKQNGRIFFVDRDPDKLSTYNRPLSQNGGVYLIYERRYPIYCSTCDHQIKNNSDDFNDALSVIYGMMYND